MRFNLPICGSLLCVAFFCGNAGAAPPPVNVRVNFDSTSTYRDSSGRERIPSASGMTQAEKNAVLAKAQEKFDQALGPGKVVVSEGTGGDVNMVVSGNSNPPGTNIYGNSGRPGGPGVVYAGRPYNDGLTGTGLTNAVGETLAHEIGHKLGLNHHYLNEPSLLMDNGRSLTPAHRAADERRFTPEDARILQKNIANLSSEPNLIQPPSAFAEAAPAGTEGPGGYAPWMMGDDSGMDVSLNFTGPAGSEFGFMSQLNDFVFQGDTFTPNQMMGFLYAEMPNLAVRLADGSLVSLATPGAHTLVLLDPNPLITSGTPYMTMVLNFTTPQGPAEATMTVLDPQYDVGFAYVPEPGGIVLAVIGIAAAWPLWRRIKRASLTRELGFTPIPISCADTIRR